MTAYDAIVLGTGGVGSAALHHLARRGARVLGLDRFPPGHDRGASHGHTRVIRKAYFEHPDYVPLLERAYVLWRELETRAGTPLLDLCGLLEVGRSDGTVIPGVLDSARLHGLVVEVLDAREVVDRFPGFVLPDGHAAVLEPGAGYLLVEDCVRAHAEQAVALGAEVRTGDAVTGWLAGADGVEVRTGTATHRASRLVVTAGPWTRAVLHDVGVELRVLRKHVHWFACEDRRYQRASGCPAFFYEVGDGFFYGIPAVGRSGVKVAEHGGGVAVGDPLTDDRAADPLDRERVTRFVRAHLPGVSGPPTGHGVCYYTMSPDAHFVVDRHPDHPAVVFAAGLSGHGFKFASVLGEALADLALDGVTRLPIGFLGLGRPGLRA